MIMSQDGRTRIGMTTTRPRGRRIVGLKAGLRRLRERMSRHLIRPGKIKMAGRRTMMMAAAAAVEIAIVVVTAIATVVEVGKTMTILVAVVSLSSPILA